VGLKVEHVSLYNFRCFSSKEIDLSAQTTIFVGKNAAGKTNTVEALQLLTAGYSFRKPTPSQLLLTGTSEAKIEISLTGDGRKLENTCTITERRRQFLKNGKKCQAADISGTLMSVLFNPDDLSMIKGGASYRREEFDDFGRQANKSYIPRQLSKETSCLNLIGQMKTCLMLGIFRLQEEGLRFFMREFICLIAWQKRHVRSTRNSLVENT